MKAWLGGLASTAAVVLVALAVALLAVWVWPSAPSGPGGAQPEPEEVDVTGPVGRIGDVSTGPNAGGYTDESLELPGVGVYRGRPGAESVTAPIGGFEPAYGAVGQPGAALATPAAGAARVGATPTTTRGR
jgi:hypothetical protein